VVVAVAAVIAGVKPSAVQTDFIGSVADIGTADICAAYWLSFDKMIIHADAPPFVTVRI